jgi:hypothetical protein
MCSQLLIVHFIHGSSCSIQVLSEDELLKLKEEAPKYKDLAVFPAVFVNPNKSLDIVIPLTKSTSLVVGARLG